MKKLVSVVAALITHDNNILCMQRKESKYDYISRKFEFPGGKIEAGETEQEALKRELMEEMEMEVEVGDKYLSVEHEYPDFVLNMQVYACVAKNKEFVRKEHIAHVWARKEELLALDWAGADLPVVHKLLEQTN